MAEAVHAAITEVDRQMSTWKPDSDLSHFNRHAVGEWFAVPHDLAFVVAAGLKVSRSSQGAFDMTLGEAVNAWGFGPTEAGTPVSGPPEANYSHLEVLIDPPRLRKAAEMYVDLSGIAKGFGVDKIAGLLAERGITAYLVAIDGEVRACGRKPDGRPWTVGLDEPTAGSRGVWDVWEPRDCALATSGEYRRFRVLKDRVVSHTIDAGTGAPVDNAIASVTVCDASCMIADAWATALTVMGPEKGVMIAQAHHIPALFLIRNAEGLTSITTGDIERHIGI